VLLEDVAAAAAADDDDDDDDDDNNTNSDDKNNKKSHKKSSERKNKNKSKHKNKSNTLSVFGLPVDLIEIIARYAHDISNVIPCLCCGLLSCTQWDLCYLRKLDKSDNDDDDDDDPERISDNSSKAKQDLQQQQRNIHTRRLNMASINFDVTRKELFGRYDRNEWHIGEGDNLEAIIKSDNLTGDRLGTFLDPPLHSQSRFQNKFNQNNILPDMIISDEIFDQRTDHKATNWYEDTILTDSILTILGEDVAKLQETPKTSQSFPIRGVSKLVSLYDRASCFEVLDDVQAQILCDVVDDSPSSAKQDEIIANRLYWIYYQFRLVSNYATSDLDRLYRNNNETVSSADVRKFFMQQAQTNKSYAKFW
jgi:hypothetical protein